MTITLEAALVKMFITTTICLFVYLTVSMILRWIRQMAEDELPMFTYGECVKKEQPEYTPGRTPIGFQASDEETSKDKTDKEIKEAILTDPITMTAALLRGEVDIDDITT